ncbi:MAG: PH domain-containing protein [Planctomycetota bacterium]
MTTAAPPRKVRAARVRRRVDERAAYAPAGGSGDAALTGVGELDTPALQDGETILLRTRPAGRLVILASAIGLVLSVAVLAVLGQAFQQSWRIPLMVVALGQLGAIPAAFMWATTRYVLTDRRVLAVRGGVISRAVERPLVSVGRVACGSLRTQGWLSIGSVLCESAADAGHAPVEWVGVARPEACRQAIADAVKRYGRHDVKQ